MPLKLNVGLSRKVGESNYGSRGASVNLELELESGLISEPNKLQERIRQLFKLAKSSVDEELSSNNSAHAETSNGNSERRQATQSQVRAIHAIANRQRLNLATLLQDRFRVGKPDQLSISDASKLIDELIKGNGQ